MGEGLEARRLRQLGAEPLPAFHALPREMQRRLLQWVADRLAEDVGAEVLKGLEVRR